MRRRLAGCVWLAIFLAAGFMVGELARPLLVVGLHNPFWAIWPYAGEAGTGLAAVLFLIWAGLRWRLVSRKSGLHVPKPIPFGPLQAVWLVVGFLVMQFAGLMVWLLLINTIRLAAMVVTNRPPVFDAAGPGADVLGVLAGTFAAGWWSIWYISRRGPARLRDGSPAGIAWCGASRNGYRLAILFAFLIMLVVAVLFHFLPPDETKLENLPDARLFSGSGWPAYGILALSVLIAPPLEEFVFRGGVFAALATRFSPLSAGVITTLAFVAVHAPDKIYYPPGFIDVGLMAAAAAWMRVKFRSIRPGILLHVLYNA